MLRGIQVSEIFRNAASARTTHLVAGHTGAGFQGAQKFPLVVEVLGNAVATRSRAGKFALCGDIDQGEPVPRRVYLRGGGLIGGLDRFKVQHMTRAGGLAGRIHQTVAPHPYLVFGVGQIRQHVASPIVRHHDLCEGRGQVGCFRNDPYARFRTVCACHYAADVVAIERGRRHGAACGKHKSKCGGKEEYGEAGHRKERRMRARA